MWELFAWRQKFGQIAPQFRLAGDALGVRFRSKLQLTRKLRDTVPQGTAGFDRWLKANMSPELRRE